MVSNDGLRHAARRRRPRRGAVVPQWAWPRCGGRARGTGQGASMAQVDTDDGRGLLDEQRRAAIAAEVRARGGVREKVHGGAVAHGESSAHEPGFEAKRTLETAAKEAIAEAAAALVQR